jgi:hypothetical protein
MKGGNIMRRLMGVAVGCFLALALWGPAARAQDVVQDQKDIPQDRRDLRQDRHAHAEQK